MDDIIRFLIDIPKNDNMEKEVLAASKESEIITIANNHGYKISSQDITEAYETASDVVKDMDPPLLTEKELNTIQGKLCLIQIVERMLVTKKDNR
jgi:hypothetical protein|tara:strand:- start:5124 stop:5408 length:285 start_codon:yes stop_codon:yes gene_type:complete